MGKTIGSIGSFLALAGVASIILYFIGWNLVILMWIDMWGPVLGWVIRIGVTVLGAGLFVIGMIMKKGEEG
ncbi:MAG: hypothetical protein ABIJ56_04500 [Pseudomonadota bacterium]